MWFWIPNILKMTLPEILSLGFGGTALAILYIFDVSYILLAIFSLFVVLTLSKLFTKKPPEQSKKEKDINIKAEIKVRRIVICKNAEKVWFRVSEAFFFLIFNIFYHSHHQTQLPMSVYVCPSVQNYFSFDFILIDIGIGFGLWYMCVLKHMCSYIYIKIKSNKCINKHNELQSYWKFLKPDKTAKCNYALHFLFQIFKKTWSTYLPMRQ